MAPEAEDQAETSTHGLPPAAAAAQAGRTTHSHRSPPSSRKSHARTMVYELYPCSGRFSNKVIDYNGTAYLVAANSVRQAYAVADHPCEWINPEARHLVGVVSIYRREKGFRLWCGCSGHDIIGGQVDHGAGIRALRAAIELHNSACPNRQPTLIERLRRHRKASS